jgi:hypothetical protein
MGLLETPSFLLMFKILPNIAAFSRRNGPLRENSADFQLGTEG